MLQTQDEAEQDQDVDEERETVFNQTIIFWIQAWEEKGQKLEVHNSMFLLD